LLVSNRQAAADLVMALAGFREAKSVAALSQSPLFPRQFSSMSKAIASLAKNHQELRWLRRLFRQHSLQYFPVSAGDYLQTDAVNLFRQYSPCVQGGQYRHKANRYWAVQLSQ
jgi:hypothetical protein